jgi:hypothetical protein
MSKPKNPRTLSAASSVISLYFSLSYGGRESRSNKRADEILRIYFNNHYGGKAVVNTMEFKGMNGMSLSAAERKYWNDHKDVYLETTGSAREIRKRTLFQIMSRVLLFAVVVLLFPLPFLPTSLLATPTYF